MQTSAQGVRPLGSIPWDVADVDRAHVEFRRSRDPALRQSLVETYRPLAQCLARRHVRHREPHADLMQCALLALVLALDRFDPARGVKFTTYAWVTISGELKRHYRDNTWLVHVPRSLQEQFAATTLAEDTLLLELGRRPTTSEIAERTGTNEEQVRGALDLLLAYFPASLDAPSDDGTIQLGELSGAEDGGFDVVDDREVLAPLLKRLPLREQRILHLRFVEGMTQLQIGRLVGLGQMQVSRLLASSLASLREWMEVQPA
jgi:RNA polymerase sigma-B factor